MEKVRETTEKRDPGGQEGKAEQFPKVEAEQAQKSMVSTVFGSIPRNPSLLEEDLGQLGAWCYSVLSEVMAKSQCTEAEYHNAARGTNIILNHTE